MKRIIDGKAYNTETALHVATARRDYEDDKDRTHSVEMNLYRTKGGSFFLVEIDRGYESDVTASEEDEDVYRWRIIFHPVTYDTAHSFARGDKLKLAGWSSEPWQIELQADDIFPTVPEAAETVEAAE